MSAAPTMFSLPNAIHEVHGTASARKVNGTEGRWNLGLIFARDHGCRLFARFEDDPSGGNIFTYVFSSLADMRDSLNEWLARVGLPDTVADAIAAPGVLADSNQVSLPRARLNAGRPVKHRRRLHGATKKQELI